MEIVSRLQTADKQTTRRRGCSVALDSSNQTPLYRVNDAPLSVTLTRQAGEALLRN